MPFQASRRKTTRPDAVDASGRADSGRSNSNQFRYVSRLGPSVTGLDLELHGFALVQSPKPDPFDGGVMDEQLVHSFRRDETVPLLVVEPFDGATRHAEGPPCQPRDFSRPEVIDRVSRVHPA